MSDEAPELTPAERLQAAQQAFESLNRVLPDGVGGFSLPPHFEATAALDALILALIANGTLDEEAFRDAKMLRMAELLEQLAEQARAFKRQMSGLVLPGNGPTRAG